MSSTSQDQKAAILSWLQGFNDSSKSLDADSMFDTYFTEDISLQYANNPVISGPNVREMFRGVFGKLDMMTHDIKYFDFVSPRIYQSATIRYLVKGDKPDTEVIEIPGFVTFHVRSERDGKLRCYRSEIFVDASPVFQRIAEKGL